MSPRASALTPARRLAEGVPAVVLRDKVLGRLREAETALRQAATIHQAKLVADVAAAQEVFAHRQRLGDEVIGYAHSIKIEALARLGDLLKVMPKATGTQAQGRPKLGGSHSVPPKSSASTYADLGLDKKTAAIAQQLAALPAVTREKIAAREQSISEVLREQRTTERRRARLDQLATLAAAGPLTSATMKFPIVYADPPWRYEHAISESRAIENHYPTMPLDAICALPVGEAVTDDAVLFLWATSPKLAEALRVVDAWGFVYRTSMVWVKPHIGMGYYARQRHELLLIATKGTPPAPAPADRPDSVVSAPIGAHSAKPDVFYDVIERMYPTLPRIEMFARQRRKGWRRWGNQSA